MAVLLILGLVIVLMILGYLFLRPRPNLPPGLPALPIVGSLPWLDSKDPLGQLVKLHRKYGDIITIHMGMKPCIYLNSYDVNKEALVTQKNNFADRPGMFILETVGKYKGDPGFTCSNGHIQAETRSFTTKALIQHFQMGTVKFENSMIEEIQVLLDELDEHSVEYDVDALNTGDEQPDIESIDLLMPMTKCTANIINKILIGRRFDLDDEMFVKRVELFEQDMLFIQKGQLLDIYPSLRFFPFDVFGFKEFKAHQVHNEQFWRKLIEENKDKDSLMKLWIQKTQENPESDVFKMSRLRLVFGDLFAGSIETVKNVIDIIIAFLLHYPDVQAKLHNKIDEVIGRDRLPSLSDRENLRYVEAVCYEVMRLKPPVPLSVPHVCSKDTTIAGYDIPSGTTIFPNIYAAHHDPNVWTDPEKFDPSRFIDEDGEFRDIHRMIAFSMGKRVCPGEAVARMKLFLMFTALLQRYKFSVPPGTELPDLNCKLGLTLTLNRYKVCLSRRY